MEKIISVIAYFFLMVLLAVATASILHYFLDPHPNRYFAHAIIFNSYDENLGHMEAMIDMKQNTNLNELQTFFVKEWNGYPNSVGKGVTAEITSLSLIK